jgi:hypothetical protein
VPIKTKWEILPQLAPLKRWSQRIAFTQKVAVIGVGGAILLAVLVIQNPSLVGLFASLAGFFAGLAANAFFKGYENEADLVNHRRKLLGPIEYRAKALVEDHDLDYIEYEKRFRSFKELQDSEEFGFLSDDVQGIYLDCVDLAKKYGQAIKGELKVSVIPNDFFKPEDYDVKQVARTPLSRVLDLLRTHCRVEAKTPSPIRTLKIGTEKEKKLGRLILYRKTVQTSAD